MAASTRNIGGHGVWRYDPHESTWTDIGDGGSGHTIRALAWDGTGLYTGTDGAGAWRYNPGTDTWTVTKGGMSSYDIWSLAWDGTGLYAGTYNHGVWRYDPGTEKWTDTGGDVSGYTIFTLAWDGTGLYAGTLYGIWRYDPGKETWTDTGGEVSGCAVISLAWDGTGPYAGIYTYGVWHIVPTYTIAATADPPYRGTITGAGTYNQDETVDLTASPDTANGYHFVDWTEGGVRVSTEQTYSFTATSDRTLVARFALNQYDIAATADPLAGGIVTGTSAWADTGGGMSASVIYPLAWDGTGLYAGTWGRGVWHYDPGTGAWTDTGGGMSARVIYSLARDGTGLYAGTDHGVWYYDPGMETWTDTGGGVSGYNIDSLAWDGTGLYAGTYLHGAWRYNPATSTWSDTGGGVSGYSIISLAWDGTGRLYAGTNGYGVWRYNPATFTWSGTGGGVSGYTIHSLVWDGSGLYAGTWLDGVWRYNPASSTWSGTGGGVSGYTIHSLAWDGSGLYAGTEGYGVWHYDPRTSGWDDIGDEVSDDSVWSLAWSGSGLYAGTGDNGVWGCNIYIHGDTVNLTAIPDTASGYHFVIWTEDGIGVSTSAAYAFTATSDRDLVAHFALNQYHIAAIADPIAGGTVAGASTWTDTGGGMSGYSCYSMAWDGTGLYAGTEDHGVWHYNPGTETWAGTGGGVSGYSIYSLAWDGTGLYAGTNGGHGVWRYDPGTETWADTGGGVSGYTVSSLAWDGTGLYAGTYEHGVWRYDPHDLSWTSTGGGMSGYDVSSLAWDGTGLYAGTPDHGVWRYDPGTETWTGPGISGYNIMSLAWDGFGLYAGTYDHGVWRYDPHYSTWTDTGGGMSSHPITSLAWDGTGLYAGMYTGSVWSVRRYNPGTGIWTDTGGGLSNNHFWSLAWDGSGLYAGTNGYGVWRYDTYTHGETVDLKAFPDTADGYHFVNWTEDGTEVSTSATYSFTATSDRTLVAHFALNQYTIAAAADPLAGGTVTGRKVWADTGGGVSGYAIYSLTWDGSGLYAGTADHGVWRYNPGTETWTDTGGGVSSYVVLSLAWDGTGLYAGTYGHGVWRYNPGTETWTDTGGGVSGYEITSLAWDGTGLYAGTSGHCVWRYNPGTETWTFVGAGVSSYLIDSLTWDGTGLYAGTGGAGVWRYNPGTETWTDTGMSVYNIDSLTWDGTGLYAGTDGAGVWRYNPGTETWTDTGGGMSSYYVRSLAWDGSGLYAGTADHGVWRYDPVSSTWTDTGGGVSNYSVLSLARVGSRLYAGTNNNGVWRYDDIAYIHGDTVNLAASPAIGYHFVNWTEGGVEVSTDQTYIFIATVNRNLVAHFALNQYTIAVSADPVAGGTITGAGTYNHGATVNLTASPDLANHYHFVNWTEGGVEVSTDQTYIFIATVNRNLVAHFALNQYTIAVSADPVAGGTITGAGTYNHGATVNLAASHVTEYHFVNWTEGAVEVSTSASYSFNATAARTLVAHFVLNTYVIAATADPPAGGTITGTGTYTHGDTVDLTASPDIANHYHFVNWTEGASVVSTSAAYSFNATAARTLVAHFALNAFAVNASVSGGHGTVTEASQTVNYGASATVHITPEAGYKIASITDNGAAKTIANPYVITNVIAAHTVVVTFAQDVSPGSTWYLAEGSTNWGFKCYVSIANPNETPIHVKLTYMTGTGTVDGTAVSMPAKSQATVFPASTLGAADFSTKVECEEGKTISVDRTMYWTGTDAACPEAHCATGVTSPATTWYLPEGSSAWGFECFLLIQNPNASTANCKVTWMIEGRGLASKQRLAPRQLPRHLEHGRLHRS